ncbi:MAG: TIGR00730 family Rossman fold protein [Candidatus Omnitrophica bacterium]|nr:TIGR00730 family Rossman fold protein [Candidatus Omnitrophota bacterium]
MGRLPVGPLKKFPARVYSTGHSSKDAAILKLLSEFEDPFDRRLLAELMTSAYRLGMDRASTLDLKIINTAVKELRYAFNVFRPYRRIRKVAVFGSARISPRHPAFVMAREFGQQMAAAGWMMITGAASGIMRAGHEGAGRAASFGLNIRLPFEQDANRVIASDEKLINCKYFFTRKLLFIKESHATVLLPGGFGTLDEGFECLTLIQTGKSEPRPVVFVHGRRSYFWRPLLKFMNERLVREGMISSGDRSLYAVAHSAEEATQEVLKFYSVYHSMRTVGHWAVLRLQQPLAEPDVARLAREFNDIVIAGKFRQGNALPEESDEPELEGLPRIIFQFNRRSYGRLMELIRKINTLGRL